MRKHHIVCSVSLVLAACAGSQAEEVRDARMAQTEAREDATKEAIDARSAERKDTLERSYDATENRVEDANAPGENATETLVNVSKDRAVYQSEAQTRLDKLGVRIDAAEQKLTVLGARAPTPLKTELKTAEQEYEALKKDVMGLNETPTTAWEATTQKIESRMASLDERVNDLDDAIEDV